MTESIRTGDLVRAAGAGSLSVQGGEADPRLAGAGIARTDVDGDGRIEGERELGRLFDLLDRHDGRRDGRVTPARQGRPTAAAPMLRALGEELGSEALRARVGAGAAAETRDTVVLIGMNETSIAEANALRREVPVLLVTDTATGKDTVRGADGRDYDLRSDAGRRGLVTTLGLGPEAREAVARVLDRASPGGRRELAELAKLWAPGERGDAVPPRLMVSGHGDARSFFGDDDDSIEDTELAALARAMPGAAAQIRHLHLAACQHGYEPRMQAFISVFPRLESVWGYSGFSPSGLPAQRHQAVWEHATRGVDGAPRMRPSDVAGTRRADGVSIWTRENGFVGPRARELGRIVGDLQTGRGVYERYLRGELPVTDPRSGPVAERYQALQEVVNHLDFGDQREAFRVHYERERDQALRLRFFTTHVTQAFDAHYGRVLDAGYAAVGLERRPLSGMSRREALAEVARFVRAFERAGGEGGAGGVLPRTPHATRAKQLLVEGIVELRREVVPSRWL